MKNVIFIFILDYNNEGSKQALGLTTKQVRVEAGNDDEDAPDLSNFNPDEMLTNKVANQFNSKLDFSSPPDEDFLTNNTLWPESNKLYGHGYEIISVAVSNNGKFIASGGKAQSEKHSKLFIWDATKNSLMCKLDGHVLTIVQIEFSHDDEYILSVSRDRSICLYKRTNDDKFPYQLVQLEKEVHARIIWGCSWSHDSKLFITGSRDTFIKIWQKKDNKFVEKFSKEFTNPVTCVNFVPGYFNGKYVTIIGFENGDVKLYTYDMVTNEFSELSKLPPFLAHGLAVKRIKSFINDTSIVFATCSDDYSVRIFELNKII